MKSSASWQVKGVGRHARETAQEAARRSGMSVGEWLDNTILDSAVEASPDPEDIATTDDVEPQARRRYSEYDERHRRPSERDLAAVNARIESLTWQLDQLARGNAATTKWHREDAPQRVAEAISRLDRKLDQLVTEGHAAPPVEHRANAIERGASGTPLDQALIEIANRQRALDVDPRAPIMPHVDLPRAPTQGMRGLEQELRNVTTRIEGLQPPALDALRHELAGISSMLHQALPRRAVEALENEVDGLSDRLRHRHRGGGAAIAGIERGLAEVRDTLRALTPAESLHGFQEAVNGLAQKIERLGAGHHNPAVVAQLEEAITTLRGIVSHVASNDALAGLSNEVRALAARLEQVASSAGGNTLAKLEQRIGSIADALQSRNHTAEQARELEDVVREVTGKLQTMQLTRADHAAVVHLEDRIAKLVEKLDASDARLNHLEAIERGLAELLIHLEHNRLPQFAKIDLPKAAPAAAAPKRELARIEDSPETVQAAIGQVVDHLATIETDMRAGGSGLSQSTAPQAVAAAPMPEPSRPAKPSPPAAQERRPIDPNLPPDHPLEPRSNRARQPGSPADRIATSEAALGPAKPPVIPDPGGKSNFIAAARRAAQAAIVETPARGAQRETAELASGGTAGRGISPRIRRLLVAASIAVLIAASAHVLVNLLNPHLESDGGPPIESTQSTRPIPLSNPPPPRAQAGRQPAADPTLNMPIFPDPALPSFDRSGWPNDGSKSANGGINGNIAPSAPPEVSTTAAIPPGSAMLPPPRPTGADKLPPAIGSGGLRAAAVKGDPTAEYEIAVRYAEGRGVPQNFTEAAEWFERAAKQGLVPAQFRLGGLYEKGLGVKKNLETARRLYFAAAQAGNAKAMHNLAVLYAEGVDGKPDYQTAAKWFRKAADHGMTDSQYNLGILYARGIGVQQNLAEAYKWFALGARDGDKESTKKRDDVTTRLDQQTLAAARLAVQGWKAEPQPEAAIEVKVPAGGWDGVAAAPKHGPRTVGTKISPSSPPPAQ